MYRPTLVSSRRQDPGPPTGPAIDWPRTLAAKGAQRLSFEHLRHRPALAAPGRLHLIVLDASGSMRRGGRLALAKGLAERLIEEAARAGDEVALLGFGGRGVELLLKPSLARAAIGARVRPIGGGGGTPLAAALSFAQRLLQAEQRRCGPGERWLWLLSDGCTLEQPQAPRSAGHIVIVDFDDPRRAIGRCASWAARWGADYRPASALPVQPTVPIRRDRQPPSIPFGTVPP